MPADDAARARLNRIRVRSWRRGTREMDLLLGPYADAMLEGLDEAGLAAFERLLEEGDPDLYQWLTGGRPVPGAHGGALGRVAAFHGIELGRGEG